VYYCLLCMDRCSHVVLESVDGLESLFFTWTWSKWHDDITD